jgi:hypothetical protein
MYKNLGQYYHLETNNKIENFERNVCTLELGTDKLHSNGIDFIYILYWNIFYRASVGGMD